MDTKDFGKWNILHFYNLSGNEVRVVEGVCTKCNLVSQQVVSSHGTMCYNYCPRCGHPMLHDGIMDVQKGPASVKEAVRQMEKTIKDLEEAEPSVAGSFMFIRGIKFSIGLLRTYCEEELK